MRQPSDVDFIPTVMGRIGLRIFFGCLLLAYTATVHAERIWIPDSNGCQLFDYPLTPGESFAWNGPCKAGKIDGQGELRFFKNGVQTMLYRGDMRNGMREGRGVQEQNGERYEGELKGNLWAGKGTHNLANGDRYVGDFAEGQGMHGRGAYYWKDGTRYEGEMIENKVTGYGTKWHTNGDRQEGQFVDNAAQGRGRYYWPSGARYEGEFRDHKFNGKGVYVWPNGDRYEGDFVNSKKTGRAVIKHANGDFREGEFIDGLQTGKGIFILADGEKYEGEFRSGKRHGEGVATTPAGLRLEGVFKDHNSFEGYFIDASKKRHWVVRKDGEWVVRPSDDDVALGTDNSEIAIAIFGGLLMGIVQAQAQKRIAKSAASYRQTPSASSYSSPPAAMSPSASNSSGGRVVQPSGRYVAQQQASQGRSNPVGMDGKICLSVAKNDNSIQGYGNHKYRRYELWIENRCERGFSVYATTKAGNEEIGSVSPGGTWKFWCTDSNPVNRDCGGYVSWRWR